MSGTDEHRPIAFILDTSAVLAFTGGSMHVHEPIMIADESGRNVAVPLICLLQAVRREPGADLHELLQHPQVEIIRSGPDDDLVLEWTLYYDGREDCAAAAVLSYQHGRCPVLTSEPDAYLIGGSRPDWVISIDGTWCLPSATSVSAFAYSTRGRVLSTVDTGLRPTALGRRPAVCAVAAVVTRAEALDGQRQQLPPESWLRVQRPRHTLWTTRPLDDEA